MYMENMWKFILVIIGSSIIILPANIKCELIVRTCEPIRVESCMGIGYNETSMPNLVGHELQTDADFTLQTFQPLIQYGCSSQLNFFLCSAYVPLCTSKVSVPIGPCRSLCESVRSRCHPVLQGFGFPWPAALDCNRFPKENNQEHMCMEGPKEPGGGGIGTTNGKKHMATTGVGINSGVEFHNEDNVDVDDDDHVEQVGGDSIIDDGFLNGGGNNNHLLNIGNDIGGSGGGGGGGGGGGDITNYHFQCEDLIHSKLYARLNRSGKCAPLCDADILYNRYEKDRAAYWILSWNVLALTTAILATICLIISDTKWDKVIMPLVTCHSLVAVGWAVRWLAGRHLTSCGYDSHLPDVAILLTDGLSNASCAVTFFLRYYFGMAAYLWWATLCFKWHFTVRRARKDSLSISPGDKQKDIFSLLTQLTAWGIPVIQTIAVLVTRIVDADELLGSCFVGNQSSQALNTFVLIPLFCYWSFGTVNLMSGTLVGRIANRMTTVTVDKVTPDTPINMENINNNNNEHIPNNNSIIRNSYIKCNSKSINNMDINKCNSINKNPTINGINLQGLGTFLFILWIPITFILIGGIYEYAFRERWSYLPTIAPLPLGGLTTTKLANTIKSETSSWPLILRAFMEILCCAISSFWTLGPRFKSFQLFWRKCFLRPKLEQQKLEQQKKGIQYPHTAYISTPYQTVAYQQQQQHHLQRQRDQSQQQHLQQHQQQQQHQQPHNSMSSLTKVPHHKSNHLGRHPYRKQLSLTGNGNYTGGSVGDYVGSINNGDGVDSIISGVSAVDRNGSRTSIGISVGARGRGGGGSGSDTASRFLLVNGGGNSNSYFHHQYHHVHRKSRPYNKTSIYSTNLDVNQTTVV